MNFLVVEVNVETNVVDVNVKATVVEVDVEAHVVDVLNTTQTFHSSPDFRKSLIFVVES